MLTLDYRVRDYATTSNAIQAPVQITFVNTTLGERMKWARDQRGLSQQQLADLAGVSQSAIGSYEAGHRKQPRELLAVASALKVSPYWLQTGEGAWEDPHEAEDDQSVQFMRGPGPEVEPDDEAVEIPAFQRKGLARRVADKLFAPAPPTMTPILAWEHPDDLPPGEFVMVPRLGVRLSAGNGHHQVEIEFTKQTPQAFRADWIRDKRLKPNKLAAMTAAGDSMEPGICDGDSLLVDTSQTDVVDGRVYALWYEGGERVKRLFRLPGGGLRIKSDNAEHGAIELGPDYPGHVRILGRVVHRSGSGGL